MSADEAVQKPPSNPDLERGTVNLFEPSFTACPQPVYRKLLERCPVARSVVGDGPVISRYEDVVWALRHPEIFSSEMDIQVALGTERPMIPQQIDPPAQTKYRKILDPRFSKRRMAEIEPEVRSAANELIDRFIDAGRCQFNQQFAIPLPCNAFLSLMGLPQEDLALFLELKDGIIRPHVGMEAPDAEACAKVRVATGQRIYAYFEDVIAARRAAPRDDLMSYLIEVELQGERLSDNEILDICFLFLLAGLDTVTATLGCNFAYLAANPEQRRSLVADASLLDGAVEELLRWETPVTAVPRLVKRDVEVNGALLKAGQMAMLLLGASNTDDGEFGNALDVDFSRERNRHLAFGAGAHRCLGSHLARMEVRVTLEEWHRRIPEYEIEPGAVPTYSAGIREVQHLPLVWKTGA